MIIAVPSDHPGGLDAPISAHFGHCAIFTLVTVDDGAIGEVSVVPNSSHESGGCMGPVHALKDHNVAVLIAGGMGARPLAGFQQVGIDVRFKEDAEVVRDAVELFIGGRCRSFGDSQTCGGGEGGCGGHHEEQPVRAPIEGRADVRPGRVVTLDYRMTDDTGTVVDSSDRTGPLRYLHGAGQILPGLERAVEGLEPGARATASLSPNEAFGERDESRIIEVPRQQLPPDARVGGSVTAEDGSGRQFVLRVVHLDAETARLDGNHPLAGAHLVFDLTIREVQAATADEIAHGHAH